MQIYALTLKYSKEYKAQDSDPKPKEAKNDTDQLKTKLTKTQTVKENHQCQQGNKENKKQTSKHGEIKKEKERQKNK